MIDGTPEIHILDMSYNQWQMDKHILDMSYIQ